MPKRKNKLADLQPTLSCTVPRCNFSTKSPSELGEHYTNIHECDICLTSYTNKNDGHHFFQTPSDMGRICGEPKSSDGTPFFKRTASSFRDLVGSYEYVFTKDFTDLTVGVTTISGQLEQLVATFLEAHKAVTIKLHFFLKLRSNKTGSEINTKYSSHEEKVFNQNFSKRAIMICTQYVQAYINLMVHEVSGMSILRLDKLGIDLAKHVPRLVHGYLPTNDLFQNRRGIINIRETSGKCFQFSVLCSIFGPSYSLNDGTTYANAIGDQKRAIKRKLENPSTYIKFAEMKKLNFMKTPFTGMDLNLLDEFEDMADTSVTIYEFDKENNSLRPYRQTVKWCTHHSNLLLIRKSDMSPVTQRQYSPDLHFVCLMDPVGFLAKRADGFVCVCRFCSNLVKDYQHEECCFKSAGVKLQFPDADRYKFNDLHKLVSPVGRVYFDFLYGTKHRVHYDTTLEIIGFSMIVMNANGRLNFRQEFVNEQSDIMMRKGPVEEFLGQVWTHGSAKVDAAKDEPLPLTPTDEDWKNIKKVTHCYACGLAVAPGTDRYAVFHHDHVQVAPVKYICCLCNLNAKPKQYVPCYGNDFLRVGAKCVLRQARAQDINMMKVIPKGDGGISSIILRPYAMLMDSRQHINQNVFQLAKMLTDDDLHWLQYHLNDNEHGELFPIIRLGLLFPHTLIEKQEDWQKTSLGSRHYYDPSLGREPTEEEFARSEYILSQCKDLTEYASLVSFTNTFIIGASMELYIQWATENFGLFPNYDVGFPAYAHSVMHYVAKPDYYYLKDFEIIKILQDSIIGGLSLLTSKHVVARSERLGHQNVPESERLELLSVDYCSLYLSVLADPYLPHGGYRMMAKKEIANFDFKNVNESSGFGYAVQVTLLYPQSVKKKTATFPLCSINKVCMPGMKDGRRVNVTLLDQHKKDHVWLHIRLLKLFVLLGLEVQAVHNVIEFETKNYLQPFVEKCIQVRNSAKTKLYSTLAKNCGNFAIGKCLQKPNEISIKLVQNEKQCEKWLASHRKKGSVSIREDLVMMQVNEKRAEVDKNLFLGWFVMQISKWKMYDAYYNHLVKVFGERISCLHINTDSFVCSVFDPQKSFTDDLKKISILELDPQKRGKTPGMLRVEHTYASEFVALNKKTYSILSSCPSCISTGLGGCDKCEDGAIENIKGVRKQMHLTHQNLLNALYCGPSTHETVIIDGEEPSLKRQKVDLTATENDDRTWIDHTTSYPLGYFDNSSEPTVSKII